jgi:DNA-binding NtrC family response regulator
MANILVLEDEVGVRILFTDILTLDKHTVWQATSAREAEQVCRNNAIDLMVADIVLPGGRSGPDFALWLVGYEPHVKVVFVSGWSGERTDTELIARMPKASFTILQKPFPPKALSSAVRALLDTTRKMGNARRTGTA